MNTAVWFVNKSSLLSQKRLYPGKDHFVDSLVRVANYLSSISFVDPLPHLMRYYSPISDQLLFDASNIAGVLASVPESEKNTVNKTLTSYIDGLSEKDITRVWAEPVGKLGNDAMLYIDEAWTGKEATTIDAHNASDGTLHMLGVMTALLTAKEGSLLIVEEIDKGLHPSRSDLLVRFLLETGRQRKVDIICTTHNPALLDAFGNEMIAFMSIVHRNETTGMSEVVLVEDIKQLPRILAKGKIGQLSSMGLLEKALS